MELDVLYFLQSFPTISYALVIIIGLLMGSFLNVVIYRLPLMLHRDWQQQCQEFLKQPVTQVSDSLTLAWPLSHCPQCKKLIRPWHNIPIISFLMLKGRCSNCSAKISWRYPFIEALSGLMTLLVFIHYGLSWQALAAAIFTWGLIALIFIDLEYQLLPDAITLSLLWIGLLLSLIPLFATTTQAILGAALGYSSLWIVGWLFKKVRGIQGIGHGDFKLMAMLGAWSGWQVLPFIALAASFAGACIGISLLLTRKIERQTPLPFGPYLALAGWLALLYAPNWHYYFIWQ